MDHDPAIFSVHFFIFPLSIFLSLPPAYSFYILIAIPSIGHERTLRRRNVVGRSVDQNISTRWDFCCLRGPVRRHAHTTIVQEASTTPRSWQFGQFSGELCFINCPSDQSLYSNFYVNATLRPVSVVVKLLQATPPSPPPIPCGGRRREWPREMSSSHD